MRLIGNKESRKPQISSDHENFPMSEVDQPKDAIHHGVAQCDKGIDHPNGETVDELLEENFLPRHGTIEIPNNKLQTNHKSQTPNYECIAPWF